MYRPTVRYSDIYKTYVDEIFHATRMYDSKEYSIKEIVSATGISQGSLYREVNRRKLEK